MAQPVMTALAIAHRISTTLIAITPLRAPSVAGKRVVRPDPDRRDDDGPDREQAAEDVEQRLRGLLALLGRGEGDERVQHGRESYRTEGRPS